MLVVNNLFEMSRIIVLMILVLWCCNNESPIENWELTINNKSLQECRYGQVKMVKLPPLPSSEEPRYFSWGVLQPGSSVILTFKYQLDNEELNELNSNMIGFMDPNIDYKHFENSLFHLGNLKYSASITANGEDKIIDIF